jgi:hypothetical protein
MHVIILSGDRGSLLAVRQDRPAQIFWKNSDIATDYAWSLTRRGRTR